MFPLVAGVIAFFKASAPAIVPPAMIIRTSRIMSILFLLLANRIRERLRPGDREGGIGGVSGSGVSGCACTVCSDECGEGACHAEKPRFTMPGVFGTVSNCSLGGMPLDDGARIVASSEERIVAPLAWSGAIWVPQKPQKVASSSN